MTEKICQYAYKDCFSNRTYITNSLKVRSVVVEGNTIHVKGKHNYIGNLGITTYTDVDFKADITIQGGYVHSVFYKWFTGWFGGHWESCERQGTFKNAEDILKESRRLYEAEK